MFNKNNKLFISNEKRNYYTLYIVIKNNDKTLKN